MSKRTKNNRKFNERKSTKPKMSKIKKMNYGEKYEQQENEKEYKN